MIAAVKRGWGARPDYSLAHGYGRNDNPQSNAKWHSLCVFENRWALAPGSISLAISLNTEPEDSDNGLKSVALG